jgi:hypothetical protein
MAYEGSEGVDYPRLLRLWGFRFVFHSTRVERLAALQSLARRASITREAGLPNPVPALGTANDFGVEPPVFHVVWCVHQKHLIPG